MVRGSWQTAFSATKRTGRRAKSGILSVPDWSVQGCINEVMNLVCSRILARRTASAFLNSSLQLLFDPSGPQGWTSTVGTRMWAKWMHCREVPYGLILSGTGIFFFRLFVFETVYLDRVLKNRKIEHPRLFAVAKNKKSAAKGHRYVSGGSPTDPSEPEGAWNMA